MALRVVSAAASLPLLILVVWVGGAWFSALVAIAAAVGTLELRQMARAQGARPSVTLAVLLAVTLIALARLVADASPDNAIPPAIAGGAAALALVWLLMRHQILTGISGWAATVAAGVYTGGLLFHAPLLRELDDGREWVILLFVVTFSTDISAFFVGKAFGKRPLAPTISPSKTWEGAIGGFGGALAGAIAAVQVLGLDATVPQSLALGALAGVAGQFGDLAVSRMKRIADVKDSGWLFPGHGGLLDRMDSIVFNLVVVYYSALWIA